MVQPLDIPVLSLAVPNIDKLDAITTDNILGMWTVFTKCKESLENGRRLENLSWRLWYRESFMIDRFGKDMDANVISPMQQSQSDHDDYFQHCDTPSTVSSACSSRPSTFSSSRSLKHLTTTSLKRIITSFSALDKENTSGAVPSSLALGATAMVTCAPDSSPAPHRKFYIKTGEYASSVGGDSTTSSDCSSDSGSVIDSEIDSDSQLDDDEDDDVDDDDDDLLSLDETNSQWSAQDDETVMANEDEPPMEEFFRSEFRKRTLPDRPHPTRPSLLSTMLATQPTCLPRRSRLSRPPSLATPNTLFSGDASVTPRTLQLHNASPQQKRSVARRRLCTAESSVSHSDLTVSLRHCVAWEHRQNVTPVTIHSARRPSRISPSSPTTALSPSTLKPWTESFRGW